MNAAKTNADNTCIDIDKSLYSRNVGWLMKPVKDVAYVTAKSTTLKQEI